jgi:hypothetical protein
LESGQESKLSPKAARLTFDASSNTLYAVPHSQKGVKRYDTAEPTANEVPISIAGYSRMSVWTPAGLLISSKSKTVLCDEVTGDELVAFPGAGEVRATSDGALMVLATSAGTIDVFCHTGSFGPK